MMDVYHSSVLLREVISALNVTPGKWYLDATLGDGGHSLEILMLGGKVVGLDVDPDAIKRARSRLQGAGYREQEDFKLIQSNFRDVENLNKQTDTDLKFAGAIFDLGVSSLQLMDPGRGFSFNKLGPLDMRMDPTLGIQALDLVNNLTERQLYEIFKNLGEEKHSKRLADALVRTRKIKPFGTTLELAGAIERVVGGRRERIHPATRVFQALRMAVNDELGALEEGLEKVKEKMEKNGLLTVISFHSLEDRIVKFKFKQWEEEGLGRIITDKPLVPQEQEVLENPKSRSAKLRIFEIGGDNNKLACELIALKHSLKLS